MRGGQRGHGGDAGEADLAARLRALEGALAGALAGDEGPAPAGAAAIDRIEALAARLIARDAEARERVRRTSAQFAGLVEMVTALAALDYSKRVEVHEGEDDSVNALAIGLNMMAEELMYTTNELVRARDQAMAASRTKSAFLANMSHELRTPLNAIIGYSELLCEDYGVEMAASMRRDLERITGAARHLLNLIQDTLDLTKIEAEKLDLELGPVVIAELVDEVTTTMEASASRHGNTLSRRVEVETPVVIADGTRLRQILYNLVGNAIKFTQDGQITLELREEVAADGARWHRFAVIDTGIGIAVDKQEQIFEAFGQADEGTTRRYGGTGLGLTISRRLCEIMGGHLSVTSTPGEGSTFVASLPVTPAPR